MNDEWDDGKYGAVRNCMHIDSELVSWNSYSEWLKISIIIREDYVSHEKYADKYWTGANKYFGSVWEFFDDDTNYNRGRVPMDYGWEEGHKDGECSMIHGETGKLSGSTYCWGYVVCQQWK